MDTYFNMGRLFVTEDDRWNTAKAVWKAKPAERLSTLLKTTKASHTFTKVAAGISKVPSKAITKVASRVRKVKDDLG